MLQLIQSLMNGQCLTVTKVYLSSLSLDFFSHPYQTTLLIG